MADTAADSFGSSGGGISRYFPVPLYQSATSIPNDISTGRPGRGIPDVSADGDPASGYFVRVDGEEVPIGGTSAAAPLWAALIVLINQKLAQRVGFINPILYANGRCVTSSPGTTRWVRTTSATVPPMVGIPAQASGARTASEFSLYCAARH